MGMDDAERHRQEMIAAYKTMVDARYRLGAALHASGIGVPFENIQWALDELKEPFAVLAHALNVEEENGGEHG
jgi:hypothetical protein